MLSNKDATVYPALRKKYDQYVELYLFLNNGSSEGITNFGDFYWRFVYNIRYSEPHMVSSTNM